MKHFIFLLLFISSSSCNAQDFLQYLDTSRCSKVERLEIGFDTFPFELSLDKLEYPIYSDLAFYCEQDGSTRIISSADIQFLDAGNFILFHFDSISPFLFFVKVSDQKVFINAFSECILHR